jgi:dTDP-4-amino-4,6-dideoxygalactose transaminase
MQRKGGVLRVSRSVVGDLEKDAVWRVLDRGYLGTGSETQRFEEELAAYIGGGVGVVCVNSGTAALHLALQALGVGPGDEVLVPSLTFVASFQAVSATGATPAACDIEEATGLLDLADAARRVTPRTKVVMPVHYASASGDLDAVYAFARERGLRVVDDAAHAFGCTYHGRRIGSFGDVVCFSFDGIKNITCGEGGAVVTRDLDLLERVQDARLLGVEKDTERRYRGERSWDFEVHDQGWRYHMSDIMAAVGRVQLQRFETEFKPKRIALAQRYRERLGSVAGLRLFAAEPGPVVPHILPVRILDDKRDRVRQALADRDIETGVHYKPNHMLARYGAGASHLPVAERLYRELLTLPLHPLVGLEDVDLVTRTVAGEL